MKTKLRQLAEAASPGFRHVQADEYHGHYVEDASGETVCDLYYTGNSGTNEHPNAENNAKFIEACSKENMLALLDELGTQRTTIIAEIATKNAPELEKANAHIARLELEISALKEANQPVSY